MKAELTACCVREGQGQGPNPFLYMRMLPACHVIVGTLLRSKEIHFDTDDHEHAVAQLWRIGQARARA